MFCEPKASSQKVGAKEKATPLVNKQHTRTEKKIRQEEKETNENVRGRFPNPYRSI
jgi:hypothetical protein